MNTYKIKSVSQNGGSIITTVEYNNGSETYTVDVTHFHPTSIADIEVGIRNRFSSEEMTKEAIATCSQLVPEIELNQTVEI